MGAPVGHILDSNTLALWRHDEVSGTAIIDATGNYPLTAGPQTSIVPGNIKNARQFTGIGTATGTSDFEYGAVDAAFVTAINGDFTIEALIKSDQQNGGDSFGAIFTFGWGTPDPFTQFCLEVKPQNRGGNPTLEYAIGFDGAVNPPSSPTYPGFDGQWTHVAARVRGTLCQYYVNGLLTFGNTISRPSITTNPFVLLGSFVTPGGPSRFKGVIDEIRISKVARTEDDIRISAERCLGLPSVRMLGWVPDSATDFSAPMIDDFLTDHSGGTYGVGFWNPAGSTGQLGHFNSFIPGIVVCPVDGLAARYFYDGSNNDHVILTGNGGNGLGPPTISGYASSDLLSKLVADIHTFECCMYKPNSNYPGGNFNPIRICTGGETPRAAIQCYTDGTVTAYVQSNDTGLYTETPNVAIFPSNNWIHLRAVVNYINNTISLYAGKMGKVPDFMASAVHDGSTVPVSGNFITYGDDYAVGRLRCSHVLRTDAYPLAGGAGDVSAFNGGLT